MKNTLMTAKNPDTDAQNTQQRESGTTYWTQIYGDPNKGNWLTHYNGYPGLEDHGGRLGKRMTFGDPTKYNFK
ncbi:MAG: hypothetical protein EZS28_032674 [Streblomastix strix]|uniref:Uncharacterized protein n=1 Tax=Streblomastix strix TaxID=222440 RepID=A0A5J4UMZ2_9EUKA|nr:MAG: hypothetical protein EZS28_032674 [Streblomastix strix]